MSGTDAGVREIVERFEDGTTPGLWNNGAFCACGGIAIERVGELASGMASTTRADFGED